MYSLADDVLQQKFELFLKNKSNFKGVNVFDLMLTTDSEKDSIYAIFDIEDSIKKSLKKRLKHFIPNKHYKDLIVSTSNVGLIDVIVYRDSCNLFKKGAFVNGTNGRSSFVPLSITEEFNSDTFWKTIDLSKHFSPDDNIYVYYGVLDTLGLEYNSVINEEIPYNKYKLHRSSSLSNVIKESNIFNNNEAVLYGGLDYGDNLTAEERGATKGFLKYSEIEVHAIADILEKIGMDVSIKDDINGTSESLLQMSRNSPRIIHLATHGYSYTKTHKYNIFEDRFNYYRQNTDIQQKEWLMNNTGLFMSLDSLENNVLRSNSVASCDFSQTELVVLSACSTMFGQSSDGNMQTIGLTTAFTLSSAHNIISSLRNVDDEKTCEFMKNFYNFYISSLDIYDSFRKTVLKMQDVYPNDSQYWKSFVLVEN